MALPLLLLFAPGDTPHVAQASGTPAVNAPLVVSGIVYEDGDADGRKSGPDVGLSGWEVSLLGAEEFGFPTDTTTTNSDGRYTLTLPVTPSIAAAPQLLVVAVPPTPEPEGYRWVTTATSKALAAIPDANLLKGPFDKSRSFAADFAERLEPGSRPRRIKPFDHHPSDLLTQPEVAAHPPHPAGEPHSVDAQSGTSNPSRDAAVGRSAFVILPHWLPGEFVVFLGVLLGCATIITKRALQRRVLILTTLLVLSLGVMAIAGWGNVSRPAKAASSNDDGLAAPLFRPAVVKNDTGSYSAMVSNAVTAWNSGGTSYLGVFGGSGTIDLWVVTYGSFADYYLSSVIGIPTCVAEAQQYPYLLQYKAWEANYFDISNGYGFMQYGHVCLYPPVGSPTTLGFEHEFGHGLYLAHDSEGVMNTCWCKAISSSERNLLVNIYGR